MSIHVSEALDYSPKEISAGTYMMRIVNPESGQQPTLAQNSTVNTDFLLPNKPINLARSYLNFDLVLAASGGVIHHGFHNGFLAPIDGITLSTASGVRLVDLNNVPEFTKLVWRPQTDYQDFLTFPCHTQGVATVATAVESGFLFHRIRAANDATTVATQIQSAYIDTTDDGKSSGTPDVRGDNYTAVSPWIGSSAEGLALAASVRLPLKMIYGSLLAVDKDLYFGEQLRLTIRWNQANKFAWQRSDTGHRFYFDADVASIDCALVPTMSSLHMRVAVETNDAIASALVNRVHSGDGINLNIPFTYSYRATAPPETGSTNAVIRKLNRGHGSKCLRVIAGVFGMYNQGTGYVNNNNAAGIKLTAYRNYLDSKPLSDSQLRVNDHTAYAEVADKLKGSVIKSETDYLQNCVVIEDFSGVPRTKDYVANDTHSSGLDLSTEREFMFEYVNALASAPIYLFAVCQKQLHITKSGISCM